MIYYNIYKHINNEKILIKTVNDIREVTFIDDDAGIATYSVSKIDYRGESSDTLSNTITILGTPKECSIIEENNVVKLITYGNDYTNLIKVEKSYNYYEWITIYDGIVKDLELENENKIVYYRYFLYLDLSNDLTLNNPYNISKPSNIIKYNPLETKDLNFKAIQVSDNTIEVSWNNSYYLQYKLYIDNQEYNTYDNTTNKINIEFNSNIIIIKIEAYKGMQYNEDIKTVNKKTVPNTPEYFSCKVFDKKIFFRWSKKENELYSIFIGDRYYNTPILENKYTNKFIYEIEDYPDPSRLLPFSLYASNSVGYSENGSEVEAFFIKQPTNFTFENIVDENYITKVKLVCNFNDILNFSPYNFDVNIFTSNYKNKYYNKILEIENKKEYPELTNLEIIIPKKLFKKYFKIQYKKDNIFYSLLSNTIKYNKPKPVKPKLSYKKIGTNLFGINTYLFTWEGHDTDMAYSIYKNGVLMNRFPDTVHNYTMSVLPNEIVCVHSHIGYEDIESNYICITGEEKLKENELWYFSFNNSLGSFNTGFLRS